MYHSQALTQTHAGDIIKNKYSSYILMT